MSGEVTEVWPKHILLPGLELAEVMTATLWDPFTAEAKAQIQYAFRDNNTALEIFSVRVLREPKTPAYVDPETVNPNYYDTSVNRVESREILTNFMSQVGKLQQIKKVYASATKFSEEEYRKEVVNYLYLELPWVTIRCFSMEGSLWFTYVNDKLKEENYPDVLIEDGFSSLDKVWDYLDYIFRGLDDRRYEVLIAGLYGGKFTSKIKGYSVAALKDGTRAFTFESNDGKDFHLKIDMNTRLLQHYYVLFAMGVKRIIDMAIEKGRSGSVITIRILPTTDKKGKKVIETQLYPHQGVITLANALGNGIVSDFISKPMLHRFTVSK